MHVYGKEVDLTLDDDALLNMKEDESEAQIMAVKAWHRANHKELNHKIPSTLLRI